MLRAQQALKQYSSVERSTQAYCGSAYDLTKMLFNGCLKSLTLTVFHIKNNNYAGKSTELSRSLAIINGLQDCLDLEKGGELAENLDALYDYMSQTLRDSSSTNSIEKIEYIHGLMKEISLGWEAMPMECRR
jgi:flagellar secretion chaperone FliS